MDDDRLLAALGEKYSPDILRETHEPRSARELSELLDVPIATCYRRIDELVEAGLLEEHGRELSDRGRRTSVYRRTVDDLTVGFEEDEMDVTRASRDPPRDARDGRVSGR